MLTKERYSTSYASTPTALPVDAERFKLHHRLDGNDEDAVIDSMLSACTNFLQDLYEMQFVSATRRMHLEAFPYCSGTGTRNGRSEIYGALKLPYGPLRNGDSTSVTITYIDSDGVSTVLASSDYQIDANSKPPRIAPAYGHTWPSARQQFNAVTVQYAAGFGAASAVPEPIRNSVELMAGYLYEHREDDAEKAFHAVMGAASNLVRSQWQGGYA